MNKKISIIGSHSTGKTTLATLVSKNLNINLLLLDKSREILDKMKISDMDELNKQNYNTRLLFQKQILESLQPKNNLNNYIVDGNPISAIPYGYDLINATNNPTDWATIKNTARQGYKKYNSIYYLPSEIDLEPNGLRHSNNNYQKTIEEHLLNELNKEGNFKILTGTLNDRYKLIEKNETPQQNTKVNRYNHIVFEGISNSGKTTIIKWLELFLNDNNIKNFIISRPKNPNNKVIDNLSELYDNIEKNKEVLINSYI